MGVDLGRGLCLQSSTSCTLRDPFAIISGLVQLEQTARMLALSFQTDQFSERMYYVHRPFSDNEDSRAQVDPTRARKSQKSEKVSPN